MDIHQFSNLEESLEEDYQEFLKTQRFEDTPVIRYSYYIAAIEVTHENPHPDEELQKHLLLYLQEKKRRAASKVFRNFLSEL